MNLQQMAANMCCQTRIKKRKFIGQRMTNTCSLLLYAMVVTSSLWPAQSRAQSIDYCAPAETTATMWNTAPIKCFQDYIDALGNPGLKLEDKLPNDVIIPECFESK